MDLVSRQYREKERASFKWKIWGSDRGVLRRVKPRFWNRERENDCVSVFNVSVQLSACSLLRLIAAIYILKNNNQQAEISWSRHCLTKVFVSRLQNVIVIKYLLKDFYRFNDKIKYLLKEFYCFHDSTGWFRPIIIMFLSQTAACFMWIWMWLRCSPQLVVIIFCTYYLFYKGYAVG